MKDINPDVPFEIQKIINRALKKKPESRYQSVDEMLSDFNQYLEQIRAEESGVLSLHTLLRRIRQPRIAIPVVLAMAIITTAAVWFFNRQARIRWAKQTAIPEIERLIETNWKDFTDAYKLAVQAEKYLPNDTRLSELFSKCALNISIKTEPPGASIYMKQYNAPELEWAFLGVSPLEKLRIPVGIFRWKMGKQVMRRFWLHPPVGT